ncbi:MAG TPA: MurR/RpiR family transcriptional regulator [Pseudonocardiaceae bacterium]|jgi:DNA-binding MurR/RpiR family transcriptional regulator|nr:MurR/RpiR family transcriptional regulator [Pseudonocardiaceae bacterium]
MAVPPRNYAELRAELQVRMSAMAAGQRRIARVLLADPEATAFRSIGETAKVAEVHESSLVRFAASLGLPGYPALVRLCRQQLAEQAQLVRRFEQAVELTENEELLGAVVEHDQQNIARTFARLDPATWDQLLDLLTTAEHVYVMGLRKCYSVAYLLAYLLRMVRPGVRQFSPQAGMVGDDLRDLAEGDAFVALSIHRYTADTVRAVAEAKRRGLRTVALTDNPASPLVPHADLTCFVETGGVTVLRSLSAFTSLAQAMATGVALRRGTTTRSELLLDEQLLDSFDVYDDSAPPPVSG